MVEHVVVGLVATCAVLIVIDTLFLVLRFFSRCFVKKAPIGWDDLLLFPAFIVNMGLCAVGLVLTYTKDFRHLSADENLQSPVYFQTYLEPVLKELYALGPLFAIGYTLPKLSLILFYLRVFVGHIRTALWILMGLVVMEMLAFLIATLFYCVPVSYYWNRTGNGKCFQADTFYRITSGLKVLLDVALVVLPIYPLWSLQVPKIKKIGLIIVFATSIIGVIGGIVRWAYVLAYPTSKLTPRTITRLVSVIILEPNLFFIAACLPACSSLFMELAQRPRIRRFLHLSTKQSNQTPYLGYGRGQSRQTGKGSEDVERLVEGQSFGSEQSRQTVPLDEYSSKHHQQAVALKEISKSRKAASRPGMSPTG